MEQGCKPGVFLGVYGIQDKKLEIHSIVMQITLICTIIQYHLEYNGISVFEFPSS